VCVCVCPFAAHIHYTGYVPVSALDAYLITSPCWQTTLFVPVVRYIENLLKNKNYHFLTRFHFHAKNKVKDRQALAFQILKAHYFTAHDHAQEMVTLAHKKNLPADKMEQVKRNMHECVTPRPTLSYSPTPLEHPYNRQRGALCTGARSVCFFSPVMR
jgi:hypothetical protein